LSVFAVEGDVMKAPSLFAIVLGCVSAVPATAISGGFTWRDHAFPFDFLFGNHIDTHQQSRLREDGSLQGLFYVVQLDEDGDGVPDITDAGDPIMRHCTRAEHYPNCQAGWVLTAVPCIPEINGCSAMFLYHRHDHPVWLVGPRVREMDGEVFLGGSRDQIPQPGYATHFHWLSDPGGIDADGTVFPGATQQVEDLFGVDIEVPAACNVARASQLTSGSVCPGYFLALNVVAVSRVYRENAGPQWAFHHGGENIVLRPGIDISSHTNVVTSYVADETVEAGLLAR
jgi:hypothetical protein